MLRLDLLARWARLRASARINESSKKKGDTARMYSVVNQLFHERVLEACRRVPDTPTAVPEEIFIALPERLLAKIAYLCLGATRSAKESHERPAEVSEGSIDLLAQYAKLGEDAYFLHLTSALDWQQIRKILLCHGLSPVGDSILLLADIGRSARVAACVGFPIHTMLADISWMSSNRSIRQFTSLTDAEIDTGLRVCLDKRRRLYDALGATVEIREIAPYSRQGSINREKLRHISERYHDLATTLWGLEGQLENEQIRLACTPLDQAAFSKANSLPNHMRVLTQFPRTLVALENELKPHLEILRTIAKQFNTLDENVFTYFFAQYYAQSSYRGSSLKVAVESERKFDEPFDTLDPYFQTWGEGHSTTEMITGQSPARQNPPMAAAYFPQYHVGALRLLPYTPLSLDALRIPGKDHRAVVTKMIAIDSQELKAEFIREILAATPVGQRNRLIADVGSFVALAFRRWSRQAIDEECRVLGLSGIEQILDEAPSLIAASWRQDFEAEDHAGLQEMWKTWFKACEVESFPSYVPPHVLLLLQDSEEWGEQLYEYAVRIVLLAWRLYRRVV